MTILKQLIPLVLLASVACNGSSPVAPTSVQQPTAAAPTPAAPTPAPTPAPSPTTASTLEMLGVVREQGTNAPVGGAAVLVSSGPNQGKRAETDGNGFYIVRGLTSGPISLNVTSPNHQARDFPLLPLTTSRQQDMLIAPLPRIITETLQGSISGGTPRCGAGTGNFESGPCVRFNLPVTNAGTVKVQLQWNGGINDLDLYVYQGGRLLARSIGASRNEEVVTTAVGGSTVEVRVVYYEGSTTQAFQLQIERPN